MTDRKGQNVMIDTMVTLLRRVMDSHDEQEWMSLTLAHNIRQPLTVLQGYLDLSRTRYPDNSLYWGEMQSALDEALDIIQASLAFKTKRDEMTCSVLGILQDIAHRYALRLGGVRLEHHMLGEDFFVRVDRPRLMQCLGTLVDNALEAVDKETGVIEVLAERLGDVGQLRVRDNGLGVPQDARPGLFLSGKTSKSSGHGVGLVFLRRTITEFGGEVGYMAGDPGSVFIMNLPVADG